MSAAIGVVECFPAGGRPRRYIVFRFDTLRRVAAAVTLDQVMHGAD